MQNSMMKKMNHWLLPTVLILFILEVIMLPMVLSFTLADRSDAPGHTLTYTRNQLVWDSDTNIRPDGSAELKLFSSDYDSSVQASNGDALVAPGSGKDMYIRLKNNVKGPILYTAVLYAIRTDDRIPVTGALSSSGAADTTSYVLPEGVTDAQVIHAISGKTEGAQIQDIDLTWIWNFDENRTQDTVDTLLADLGAMPEISMGFYLVVEDDNSYGGGVPVDPGQPVEPPVEPEPGQPEEPVDPEPGQPDEPGEPIRPDIPKTGDDSRLGMYLGLMGISFVLLILLLWDRRRENERESN